MISEMAVQLKHQTGCVSGGLVLNVVGLIPKTPAGMCYSALVSSEASSCVRLTKALCALPILPDAVFYNGIALQISQYANSAYQ